MVPAEVTDHRGMADGSASCIHGIVTVEGLHMGLIYAAGSVTGTVTALSALFMERPRIIDSARAFPFFAVERPSSPADVSYVLSHPSPYNPAEAGFLPIIGHRQTGSGYGFETLIDLDIPVRVSLMAVVFEDFIQLWLKLNKKKPEPYVNPDLDPVLLVPGIAGSILNAVDDASGKEERVWVRILGADSEFCTKLWSRFDPSTGKTVSMNPKTRIIVPEDRYGLYAIDILDPDMIIGRDCVYYFHDMIEEMLKWGFQEGKTLFGFGYDFRQSNRFQETLDLFSAKLESVYTASGGKKINIITHSMGGLLVKCFMCLHSEVFEKYVQSWIAIAAPFRGE
ncbi:Lecithin-cholesterol acyltransferase-like 4 [Asimina triloba]